MNVYLGIFLISLTTLAFEVALTRLPSVISWYHLAFFAISTAMLDMTAGVTTVYLKPKPGCFCLDTFGYLYKFLYCKRMLYVASFFLPYMYRASIKVKT